LHPNSIPMRQKSQVDEVKGDSEIKSIPYHHHPKSKLTHIIYGAFTLLTLSTLGIQAKPYNGSSNITSQKNKNTGFSNVQIDTIPAKKANKPNNINGVSPKSSYGENENSGFDDTLRHIEYLSEISLVGARGKNDILNLPEVVGTKINAGKKNSVIILENLNTVVVNNSMRQIMAKVPGIHIWESDGSGIQIGIAHRGLSPNRSWEFNIRQNGADISADPYGYPEAYYNPPMQAIQRIQVIKGAGALQYGPQFGGLINYVMRDGKTETKPFSLHTSQTVGSFGLYNNFLAVSGRKNKFYYYAFYDNRRADGFRQNSQYETKTYYGSFGYLINDRMEISANVTQFDMLSQQPGGLLDQQISADPTQSFRSRNWFSTPWLTGNVKFNWEINKSSRLQIQAFGMKATRSSVGFLKAINIADTINKSTGNYDNRIVDIDRYDNFGTEISYINNFKVGNQKHTFTAGTRYFKSITNRDKNGKGSTGISSDFSVTGKFPQRLTFETDNISAYVEQIIRLNRNLVLIPGVRWENIHSTANGILNTNNQGFETILAPQVQTRSVIIGGIGAEYHLKNQSEIYFNLNQAYRPILFSDMLATPGSFVVSPDLKDASGINSDLGFRGHINRRIKVDASVFYMQYNNRIGSLTEFDSTGKAYTLRTNVGSSTAYGFEGLVQAELVKNKRFDLPVFASYSYNVAQYGDYFYSTKNSLGETVKQSLRGNFVENAPMHILRTGAECNLYSKRNGQTLLSLGMQYSFVSSVYTDAQNTVATTANAQNGQIPSYGIWDVNTKVRILSNVNMKVAVNNLMNTQYFTRRAGGYPGPGAMPADGRSILMSLEIKL
jgi:Fe(3+) dicitrate transport protein